MKKSSFSSLLAGLSLLMAIEIGADETPETILIRATLSNELAGHRRGDVELALSAYHRDFFAYEGHGNADPRGWSFLCENLEDFARALRQDLRDRRYEIERFLSFIHVRGAKAMVVGLDSGLVVDRTTGAAQSIARKSFWIMRKVKEEWLITGLVENIGDSLLAVPPIPDPAADIAEILRQEEEAWESGRARISLFDEEVTGYNGANNPMPQNWQIIFGDAEELNRWWEKRLKNAVYTLDRQVIYAAVSPGQQQALALSCDNLSTRYKKGSAVHLKSRYVLWTLSRRGGEWKITNMCYDMKLPD